jgi:transcription initiation factor IIE alpha subunit
LSPCDKLLWLRLRDEQMERGSILHMTTREMERLTGTSRRNIHRSLLALQNAGLVRHHVTVDSEGGIVEVLGTRRARVMIREARE